LTLPTLAIKCTTEEARYVRISLPCEETHNMIVPLRHKHTKNGRSIVGRSSMRYPQFPIGYNRSPSPRPRRFAPATVLIDRRGRSRAAAAGWVGSCPFATDYRRFLDTKKERISLCSGDDNQEPPRRYGERMHLRDSRRYFPAEAAYTYIPRKALATVPSLGSVIRRADS
jgi:hypothetical protein